LPAAGIRPRSDDTRLPTSARPANPLAIMGTRRRRGWFLIGAMVLDQRKRDNNPRIARRSCE
jgi:hypothetical protein